MTPAAPGRRATQVLSAVLVTVWVALAVAIAAEYHPGGALDALVVVACFLPVAIAAAGVAWPAVPSDPRHRLVVEWLWLAALLFALPLLGSVTASLAGPIERTLVPSPEVAYGGFLALLTLSLYSLTGAVHDRLGEPPFSPEGAVRVVVLAILVAGGVGLAFGLVAWLNDRSLGARALSISRYGPTDPALEPPDCAGRPALGEHALIAITGVASVDRGPLGSATLEGQRSGADEAWRGTWTGLVGAGRADYARIDDRAWLRITTEADAGERDAGATDDRDGSDRGGWQVTTPDPFGLGARDDLTTDGAALAPILGSAGPVVAEDVGLEIVQGAPARHCRMFVDGSIALDAFLPLRWLVGGGRDVTSADLAAWRGELDWWVFADGQMGQAAVRVSGMAGDAWPVSGVQGRLEAQLSAIDRDVPGVVRGPDGLEDAQPQDAEVAPQDAAVTSQDAALRSAAP